MSGANNHDVEFKHVDPKQALYAAIRYWKTWYTSGKDQGYDYGPTDCSNDNYLVFARPYLPEQQVKDSLDGLQIDTKRLAKMLVTVRYPTEMHQFVEIRSPDENVRTPYFVVDIIESERSVQLSAYNLCDAHAEGCNSPTESIPLGNFDQHKEIIEFAPGENKYHILSKDI